MGGVGQGAKEGERSFGSLRPLRTRILVGCSVPEWEETHATPRVLRKSAQAIEDKEFGEENRVYGKWKSAQGYEPKGVTKLKRDPSSLRSSGLASFMGYSVVKERMLRAGREQQACKTDSSFECIVTY